MGRQTILMCRPDHYDVKYVINPWMQGQVHRSSLTKAKQQWQALYDIISSRANVELIEANEQCPDLVFTANAGLVWGKKVIVSRFHHPERQTEEPVNAAWFQQAGFEVIRLPDDMHFEGAGDALFDRRLKCLWGAYGPRTKQKSYETVERYLDVPVQTLKLVDPKFYHLDTCFCPLVGGKLLYFSGAFDNASQKKILDAVPAADRFDVSPADAANFACNAVDLRGTVVFNKISKELAERVKQWGFEPVETSLTEFLKAGGAAKCLTLDISA